MGSLANLTAAADALDRLADRLAELEPPADFRGSPADAWELGVRSARNALGLYLVSHRERIRDAVDDLERCARFAADLRSIARRPLALGAELRDLGDVITDRVGAAE